MATCEATRIHRLITNNHALVKQKFAKPSKSLKIL